MTIEIAEEEVDTEAALLQISSDLFPENEDETSQSKEESAEAPAKQEEVPVSAAVEPPPAEAETPLVEETSPAVQAVGAPKTWSKEAIEDWAKIPPKAQAEILKREEDIFRGIEQYRTSAELGKQYDSVVEPYRAALAAENINPVELFQSFVGNHYLLSRGTIDQKVQIAANLVKHYGIPIDQIHAALGQAAEPIHPEILRTQQELAEVRRSLSARENAEREQLQAKLSAEVEAFATDPKNIYFQEVGDDITRLLKSGMAKSLQEAYDLAIWQNPSVRAKEISRSTAAEIDKAKTAEADRLAKAQKAMGANVKTSTKTRDGTIPVGSMDDTLKETMDAIAARG